MDTVWLTLLPFLVAAGVVVVIGRRRTACPDCGAPLPVIASPLKKTRRMWTEGGNLCAACGCEVDTAGRKVAADAPLGPTSARRWAAMMILGAVGVGLVGTMLVVGPPDPAPPVVAAPQQAAVAPQN
jgi:hypothetical protein